MMSGMRKKFGQWFQGWHRQALGLDLRTIACVRMGFGVILLLDLAVRSSCLRAHYTDEGVYPLAAYHASGVPFSFSLHAMSGEVSFQALLFLLNALAALALLFGWRTRAASLICWIFLLSLQNRNFLLNNGGDSWMRQMLFWGIFLPWGEKWSLDARDVAPRKDSQIFSAATAGYCMQVFWVYVLAGFFKTGEAWWHEGSATQLSLGLAEWSGELAYYGLYFPTALKWMTFSVLVFELVGPFLFFAPAALQHLRMLSALGFVGFHIGLAIFIEIGLFPYIGMVSAAGLLPALFWKYPPLRFLERALDRFWSPKPGTTVCPHSKRPYRPGWMTNQILTVVILYVAAWNAGSWKQAWAPPAKIQVPGYFFGFDQYWGLFAPEPPRFHNWFVAVATLSDGRKIDLIRDGQPVLWDCPTSSVIYKNQRWKRMLVSMSNDFGSFTRRPYLNYLYREWSPLFGDIQEIELIRLVQATTLDYEDVPPQRDTVVKMRRDEF
jgi:hypothetical protein